MMKRLSASSIPSVVSSWVNNAPLPLTPAATTFADFAPSTGVTLCKVQIPTQNEVEQAISSSQKAFLDWSRLSVADRGGILKCMAERLTEAQEELCHLEALDSGIPISQVKTNHLPAAIGTLEYYGSVATSGGLPGRILDTPHAGGHADSFAYTRREPLGVCGAIAGWNYPLMTMIWKLAPALVCGNSVVFKPSECTPLSALAAAQLWEDVIPSGVFQVLTGEASTAQAIVEHPSIAKISLTGSTATGIRVAQRSAETLKHLTLELGGKSPLLVFSDCDIESAVHVALEGNFINNGQVCSNCTRVFVEQSILKDFIARVRTHLETGVVMGDSMDASTNMGPMIMPPRKPSGHYERVMSFVEQHLGQGGCELVHGGRGFQRDGGYFVEPTVFVCNDDTLDLVKEEIFGPVMAILPFATEEEAIERANSSKYGLAAGVMTRDVMRAHRMAKRLQAGNVWINNWNLSPVEMPFGPHKMSGYGQELGIEALENFSQVKTVYMEMGDVQESTFQSPR